MTLQERVNYLMIAKYVLNKDYLLEVWWSINKECEVCVTKSEEINDKHESRPVSTEH